MKFLSIGLLFAFSNPLLVHYKGPTHRNLAIKCLEQLTIESYKFTKTKKKYHSQLLLTFIVTKHLDAPAFEIQEQLLKVLHEQKLWSIEALQFKRNDFQAYSENCRSFDYINEFINESQPTDCIRRHVVQIKTHTYIIIIEDIEMYLEKVSSIFNTSSFNNDAFYIIYYTKFNADNMDIAQKAIIRLINYSIRNVIVMIPITVTKFELFLLTYDGVEGDSCFSAQSQKIKSPFQCNKGKLTNRKRNIFYEHEVKNFLQCTKEVNALPYEPYVINTTSGIEVDVINEIGKILNISFVINQYENATMHIGQKTDDGQSWTGFLYPIYHFWQLGIGNVPTNGELIEDFTYSLSYHWVKFVYVVPIAKLIPNWRVLLAIFTKEMWGICLAAVLGFAMFFLIFKTKNEAEAFKTTEKCLNSAFQVILNQPVYVRPKSDFTRICFIGFAVLAIILNSVYTTSLIYYLQNPIREHQISTQTEIAKSEIVLGLLLGGSTKHKEMFEYSSNKFIKMLYQRYQTVNDSLDTDSYWLRKVALNRNMSTIAVKLNVAYLLTKANSLVTDRHGQAKVFILPKPLRTQAGGMIMRKGNYLENIINSIIQRLIIEAGLIQPITNKYIRLSAINSEKSGQDEDEHDHESHQTKLSALSVRHLEGAFAIIALGAVSGFVALLLELVFKRLN